MGLNKRIKIMVVDDDPICGIIATKHLENCDLIQEIEIVESGQQAFDVLTENLSKLDLPKVILLDLKMPIMDGFMFLDILQNHPSLTIDHFQIFLISSSTNEKDILRAKDYPIVDFFHKPFNHNHIKTILSKLNLEEENKNQENT